MVENTHDHDLLVELKTQVQNIRQDIKDLKDGTTLRISSLEKKDKSDRKEVEELQNKINNDIEVRIRQLEAAKVDPVEHKQLLKKTDAYLLIQGIYTLFMGGLTGLILFHIFYK
jgi:hypothetical protein